MQMRVSFSRKVGQANYGSAGASCEIQWAEPGEPDELMTNRLFAEELVQQIRRCYALCESAVNEQLDRQAGGMQPLKNGEPPAPADAKPVKARGRKPTVEPIRDEPPPPPPPPPPASNRMRPSWYQAPAPNGTVKTSRYPITRQQQADRSDLPSNGRQLCAWVQKQDPAVGKWLKEWGQAEGLGWKMTEWSPESVAEAVQALLHEEAASNN